MSHRDKGFFDVARYLGKDVGGEVAFLKNTACMDPAIRALIADLEFVKELFPSLKPILDKYVTSYLEKKGFALWVRDVITDMALKMGEEQEDLEAT